MGIINVLAETLDLDFLMQIVNFVKYIRFFAHPIPFVGKNWEDP